MKGFRKVVLLLDSSRSYDRGLLRGIARYVGLHEPWVVLRPTAFYERFSGLVKGTVQELWRSRPDGVIMNGSPSGEDISRLEAPVIAVPVKEMLPGCRHLVSDNREAAIVAADHLFGQGLRHFAFAGFDQAVWSLERCKHFCRRLSERGFKVHRHLVPLLPGKARQARHRTAIAHWLKSLPRPVGVMACNDDFARTMSELCRLHGLRVPEDVALVGVDNDELICRLSRPPLSSISFATEQAGYEAAELLDALMAGKKVATDRIAVRVGRIVPRQSTDLLAMEDEEVVKALRCIRDNSHRILQVTEVVEATLLSHRTLHTRFQRAMGRSLLAEIAQRRAAHIAKMLLTTSDSIDRIARSVGYDTAGHMARFFRRELGVTPRAYRQQREGLLDES